MPSNIFGFNDSDLNVSSLYINGQSADERFALSTTLTRFYQSIINTNNKLNYNLITPDVALKSDLNNLPLSSNINEVLTPYALKSDVNAQLLALPNQTNAVFNGNCTFNSNLRIRGALALENNVAILNGAGLDAKILNGYGSDENSLVISSNSNKALSLNPNGNIQFHKTVLETPTFENISVTSKLTAAVIKAGGFESPYSWSDGLNWIPFNLIQIDEILKVNGDTRLQNVNVYGDLT